MNKTKVIFKSIYMVMAATPLFGVLNLIVILLFGILPYLITITIASLFDSVNNYLFSDGLADSILKYGTIYIILFLVQFSLYTIQSVVENYGIYEKTLHVLKIQLGLKYSKLSLISYENTEIHNLAQRAKECVQMDVLPRIYLSVLKAFSSVISVVSITIGLAGYSPALLPLSLFCVLPFLISRIIRGNEFYYLKTHQAPKKRKAEYLWMLFCDAAAVKEMRVMGTGEYITEKWRDTQWQVNKEIWAFNRKDSKSLLFCNLIKSAGFVLSFLLCLYLLLEGSLSVGIFGACIFAINNVQTATKNLMIDLGQVPQHLSFGLDYFEFLELHEEENGALDKKSFKQLIFKNVSFSYPNASKKAIDNISFSVKAGEKIVVVGENGSGKTTLAKLMLGLYRVDEGIITYDKVNISEIDRNHLYKNTSVVPQDFMKCNLTLRENVGISNVGKIKDDNKLTACLSQIGFNKKDCSLDDQIGREFSGVAFSGGEWQRIAIARAMFKESNFVILDEPTSALDPLTETEILKSFIEISKDNTAIIISHRVGLCKYADKIIVMKEGKLVEYGDYNQLMKDKGVFFNMFNAQAHWYNLKNQIKEYNVQVPGGV
ncbi:MAG: ATP-binding cassette domain-containing protein [Lachnospiraceae bacterium]|nr:ATP-binding cassette domain-containing protein [Lachnospiraceae bacterium]